MDLSHLSGLVLVLLAEDSGLRLWSLVFSEEAGLRLEAGDFWLQSRGSEPDMELSVKCPGHVPILDWAASMLRGLPLAFIEP